MISKAHVWLIPAVISLIHCGGNPDESTHGDAGSDSTGGDSAPGDGGTGVQGGASGGGSSGTAGAAGTDAGGSAGTDGGRGGESGAGGSNPVDDEAPSIISISPSDGDDEVFADHNIVIEFSKPMDKASTQVSYQSADIPAGQVTFSWNADGTILTINPNEDLDYANGDSPDDVEANRYTFEITDVAEDKMGNPLTAGSQVTFTTLRRIQTALLPEAALTGWIREDGDHATEAVYVGDSDEVPNAQLKGAITISMAELPDNVAQFEEATLAAFQSAETLGTPYEDLGGHIDAFHVQFSELGMHAFSVAPKGMVGLFSDTTYFSYKEADVLLQLREDYAQREELGDRSQYRLEFPVVSDFDDTADRAKFIDDRIFLTVRYLVGATAPRAPSAR